MQSDLSQAIEGAMNAPRHKRQKLSRDAPIVQETSVQLTPTTHTSCLRQDVVDLPPKHNVDVSLVTCAYCMDILSYPARLTGCDHIFCVGCIIQHNRRLLQIKTFSDKSSVYPSEVAFSPLNCPICRRPSTAARMGENYVPAIPESLVLTEVTCCMHSANKQPSCCPACNQNIVLRLYTDHVLHCTGLNDLNCPSCKQVMSQPPEAYAPRLAHKHNPDGDRLQRIWFHHLDKECQAVECHRCSWVGHHSEWVQHLLVHDIKKRMEVISGLLKREEDRTNWKIWAATALHHMPLQSINIKA